LDKRRLEAVEKIWATVIALGPAKAISATMSIIKYDAVAKDILKNPKLRQIIESVLPSTGDHSDEIAKTMKEQPFV